MRLKFLFRSFLFFWRRTYHFPKIRRIFRVLWFSSTKCQLLCFGGCLGLSLLTFRNIFRNKQVVESSLRSKCFQSSYGAKVRKKKGEGKGRRRWNACPQTPRFWKTPLGYFRVRFICKLTARQNRSMTNKLLPRIDRFVKLLCSLIEHVPGDCKNCNKKGLR